jgi:ABC-type lipoprotein export system ATPase subunit
MKTPAWGLSNSILDSRKSTAPVSLRSSLGQMRNSSSNRTVATGAPYAWNFPVDESLRMGNQQRSSAVSVSSGGQRGPPPTNNTISREEFIEHYPQLLLDIMLEDDDEDAFGDNTELLGIDMCFKNLSLSIKLGKSTVKVVDNVTGRIRAKSMTAIMGGSGAGKTSLLNALCGRAFYGETTGSILVNGHEESIEDHKDSVGFVPQDDIVYAELTVRENLIFSGRFRLPKGTSNEEIEELADETLANLGLARVANSPVGDIRRRGVSGGEKKRVNIGLELMALPSICKWLERTFVANVLFWFVSLHFVDKLALTVRFPVPQCSWMNQHLVW